MRLYKTANGRFAGTMADAKADGGKFFSQIEVPTDKAGLIAFLNVHMATAKRLPADQIVADEGNDEHVPVLPTTAQDEQNEVLEALPVQRFADTAKEHRLAERAAFLGTSEEIALLTDRIGELDGWPLGQVALAAAARLKELADV